MGVPAFFKWLRDKYPKIIVSAVEEAIEDEDGFARCVDPTAPNPNGVEFDNFYIDMNGCVR